MTTDTAGSSTAVVWRDPTASPSARVQALMAEMTLPEKTAQLGSLWLGFDSVGGEVAPMQDVFARDVSWPAAAKDGIGQLTRVFGTAPVSVGAGVQRVREFQQTLADS